MILIAVYGREMYAEPLFEREKIVTPEISSAAPIQPGATA
jgi:hypothetical protein